jgi:RimJ/RimL family protein N-acetyltransferase
MSEEGRRRQAAFKRGRYLDVIEYGVLQHEWTSRTLQED